MKRLLLLFVGILTFFASRSSADPVSDWNATAITVMLRVPTLARSATNDMAYVHVAIYDAVNAIDGQYSVFAVAPSNAAPWASKEAAVAAAAHRVLLTFYAPQQPYIDSVYTAALALLPDDSTKTRGVAIGDTVAARFLALRAGDGRDAVVTYVWQPVGPGVYQPTPPGAAQYQPVNPWLPQLRPFSFTSPSQFRAPGPASLTSDVYTRDFNEVKGYGSRDSSLTTPLQREMARFHTENPAVQLARNIRLFAASRGMSLADNARLFAQLYVTIGDATIAGFESKYYFNAWRPSTAIREADIDGNPLTGRDTSWLPLVTTPPHPEYPAAHGLAMGALANGLAEFFGTTNVPVTLTSNVTGTQHSFTSTNDIITEAINARVYGGMHFRSSVEDGVTIGRDVAAWVAQRYFLRMEIPATNLQLWLKADAGVDTLNGTVSRWHDQSSNGNDAFQNDSNRQPVLMAGAVGGRPAIHFDGLDDKLGLTGSAPMSSMTMFMVYRFRSGDCVITLGGGGDKALGHQFFILDGGASGQGADVMLLGFSTDHGVKATGPGVGSSDQWRNLSVTTDGSIFKTTLRWNGKVALMQGVGSDWPNNFPLGDSLGSGGGIGGADGVPDGTLKTNCDVAEVIVYTTILSDSARLAVESYLNTKYKIVPPPIPTAGLQLWLKADAGVDTLNGTVSRWHDLSGNGNDAIQANASRQPSLVAGRLNGMPVVSFDGVNDKLGFTGSTLMTPFSLFVVLNNHVGTPGNDGNVITFGANGGYPHQWFMIMRYPNTPDSIAMGNATNSYVSAFSHNVAAYDQWRNLSIVTTGSVFNTTLRWDGNDAHMAFDGFDQTISFPLGDATGSGGGIGGADGVPAGTILAKCDVAEILVYNIALTDSARKTVESYLATKYGLPLINGITEEPQGNLPEKFVLEQNYPNPFNPSTVIRFSIPAGVSGAVTLRVYDVLGQEVRTLVNDRLQPGSYETRFDATGLASGAYFYRLTTGAFVQTKRLMLLR